MNNEEKMKIQVEKAVSILKSCDIKLSIEGCGCCGSPAVKFQFKGQDIIFDESNNGEPLDYCNFNMFND